MIKVYYICRINFTRFHCGYLLNSYYKTHEVRVRIMVFNATFNNILWWTVLLVEETGVPGENHRPVTMSQVTDKFIPECCIKYTSPWVGFELTLVVTCTYCIGSCKSKLPYNPTIQGNPQNEVHLINVLKLGYLYPWTLSSKYKISYNVFLYIKTAIKKSSLQKT